MKMWQLIIVLATAVVVSFFIGSTSEDVRFSRQAIRADVAEYTLNSKTGLIEFRFRKPVQIPVAAPAPTPAATATPTPTPTPNPTPELTPNPAIVPPK